MILKRIDYNIVLRSGKHVFVPNKACVPNLLEILDIITDAVNKGHSVDLVLLDFAKAVSLEICLKT